MIKLFHAPGACSMSVHVALLEAGADFEPIAVDLKNGAQHSPEYLRINPQGRVPTLVTDDGTLTEVPAILNWIAQTYPQAQLAPQGDGFALAQMQSFNLFLSSTVHIAFAHLFRPERWADGDAAKDDLGARTPVNLALNFAMIEQRLADGRAWVMGAQYSVADAYLYVFSRWLERDGAGGSANLPLTVAHRSRMQERPAVQAMLAAEGLPPL
jgi:glutathione S-transferase